MTKTGHDIVKQALELLACEIRATDTLADPGAVKDYLRLRLAPKDHEVFAVVFLDAQNRGQPVAPPVMMPHMA